MKVNIGPYSNWFGPYQLAEKILFWLDDRDKRVNALGMWLAGDSERGEDGNINHKETKLYKFLRWVDSKKKRTVKVRIDRYDTWNMDRTLAVIILPMLKQLKETKHGSPIVDMEDVPEYLRGINHESYDDQKHFDFYEEYQPEEGVNDIHARWDWVMGEMIWAFEQHQPDVDWEQQYYSGKADYKWKKTEKEYPNPDTGIPENTFEMMQGPNHTLKCDYEGLAKHQARIDNGLRLFGKYYRGLWD